MVEIQPSPPNLEISNHTDRAIFFYAIEQNFSEKIRLADPCQGFQPNLPADTTLLFPYEDIMGFDEEAEKVWFWWTDCVDNSEMETFTLYPN